MLKSRQTELDQLWVSLSTPIYQLKGRLDLDHVFAVCRPIIPTWEVDDDWIFQNQTGEKSLLSYRSIRQIRELLEANWSRIS
jgi:hypothetical protein